jgi:hypothetical protein
MAMGLAGALILGFVMSSPASSTARGVLAGTPVHVHTHSDNGVVTSVQIAARRVGLGPVNAVGFERNCSPNFGRVVVCRDTSLDRSGHPTSTSVGAGWCVVRLEPSIGAGPSAVSAVTAAFRLCLV